MLNRQQKVVLPHLCRLIGSGSEGEVPDGDLLERFLSQCDAAAFTVLLRRHGPTVLGVCQRVLNNAHDAEDAFQATFLVLARKARSINRRDSLGNWLYGVAYRVALKARADAVRRRHHERHAASKAESQPGLEPKWDDVRPILDEEVNRLPDKYRRPIVLCYFQGKTYQEAARLLGWPAGTASVRLARARDLLRTRLARRGLALSSGALAVGLAAGTAPAAELCLLAGSTAGAALLWLANPAAPGLSPQVVALTEGVMKAMSAWKLKALVGILLVGGLMLGGVSALFRVGGDTLAAADRSAPARGAEPAPDSAGPLGAPPRALAPPAGDAARPPQTRIGLINMSRVLKGSKKTQATQAELRTQAKEVQQKLEPLKNEVQDLQLRHDDPATPAATREQIAQKIRQLRNQIEDESARAQSRLSKESDEAVVALYRQIEEAANRIAKAKGLELVLFYTDAVTEEDFYNPGNIQRKMTKAGALIPMVVSPGMDITEAVIDGLNRAGG